MKKFLLIISLIFMGAASAFMVSCKDNNTVKYSFDTNGGTEISEVTKNKGEDYELPVPVRDGFEFEGWYLSDNFSGSPVTNAAAEENTTYYAKWAQLYTISLQLDGGSLSAGNSLKLKEGANVYDFMSGYTPTKSGLDFGAWFNGETELAKNLRMPATGITLTAKYKVAYEVEIYMQNIAGDAYEKSAETVKGTDFVGATVMPDINEKGFILVSNANQVLSKTLTATAADNVLKYYFDREEYTVSLRAEYPDGTVGVNETYTVKYGEKIELSNDLTFEGYCLVGWSDNVDGEVKYAVNYIDTVLYGGDGKVEPVYFTVEEDQSLYACWLKGNVDMFATEDEGVGSKDYVYLIGEDIYLSRGNVFFKGNYDAATGIFTFRNDDKKIIISGKLNDDGTYCYENDLRRDYTATLFTTGEGFDDSTTLHLDEYNGATLSVKNELGINSVSKGTYVILPSGEYVITFPENTASGELNGSMSGKTIYVRFGYANDESGNRLNAFNIRNDKEYEMDPIVRFAVTDSGDLSYYTNDILALKIDGYGNAVMNNGNSDLELIYLLDLEDDGTGEITLFMSGQSITAKLFTEKGRLGYMLYDEDNLFNIINKTEGVSLSMDGLYNAVYTVGNKTYTGSYTVSGNSLLGGTVYNFYSSEKKCKLIITVTTEGVDEAQSKTYQIDEKPLDYSESYYYAGGSLTSSYPTILALNDGAAGKASLYQRTQTGAIKLIANGTCERSSDGYMVFTKTEYFEIDEAEIIPFDVAALKSFKFLTGYHSENSSNYPVNFWVEKTEDEKVDLTTVYTSDSGAKIELVAGYAIFTKSGVVSVGSYSTASNGVTTISASNPVYVRLNSSSKTFEELVSAPYTAYENQPNGNIDQNYNLYFDGTENGVTYNFMDDAELKSVVGTYVRNGETSFGSFIYTFTATDGSMTFEFIQISTSSAQFFAKRNTEYYGIYTGKGILELDGFTFESVYTDAEGNSFSGIHMIAGENLVAMAIEGRIRYFDIEGGRSFYLRGEEYSNYVVLNNGYSDGKIVFLDGKGHAEIRQIDEDEPDGFKVLAEDAPYEIIGSSDLVSITYGEGKTLVGARRYVSSGSSTIPVLVIIHEEVEHTYVNGEDHSVFILDKIGGVIRYNAQGERERGSYTLVTNNMLYYAGSSEEGAGTYIYDTQNKTVEKIKDLKGKSYYTKDLEALSFTQYGFVVVNGASRYYYQETEDGNVIVYRPGTEKDTVNEYGFIVDDFGKFTDNKTYLGKDYIANDGFELKFKRGESGNEANNYPIILRYEDKKDEYGNVVYETRLDANGNPVLDKNGNPVKDPVQVPVKAALENLNFTPSGGSSFNNSGTVTIDGKPVSCNVIREEKNGVVETYLTIRLNVGVMRYDIEIEYNGAADDGTILNTYKITSCRAVNQYQSVMYLNSYMYALIMDMLTGSNYAANLQDILGTITIGADYDVNCDVVGDPYILTEFGERMGIVDSEGNYFNFVKTPYTYANRTYTTEVVLEDGYTYRLRFGVQQVMQSMSGYQILALTRVQTLEADGGYTVEVERIIMTDSQTAPGNPYRITLKYNGEEIPFTSGIIDENGAVYYISRTVEDNRITATVYYKISFAEKPGSTENEVTPYVSASVVKTEVTTTYGANTRTYVDITGDNEVLLIYFNGYSLLARSSVYDEQTGTYTVLTYAGTFTVKIEDGVAVVQAVEESV